jgi:hypothetical protein
MIDPRQIGSDALRRLDAFMSEPADDCEEALEWIPTLNADDWRLLETFWVERSPEWRANCAVIVGHFATPCSRAVLRLALADTNDMVAKEAAIAICGQMLKHPEFVAVDRSLIRRLQELKLRDESNIMTEVDEVLRLHSGAG